MAAPAMEDTYDKVLSAAVELFGEHGFAGTSLQAIADRVGVTKAALYYHFRTKDELLDALLRPALNDLDRVLDTAERRKGQAVRQRVLFEGYVDFLLRYRTLAVILDRDVSVGTHRAIRPRLESITERVRSVLDDTERPIEQRVASTVAMGGIYSAVAVFTHLPDDELRRVLLDIVRRLLAPRRARPAAADPE
ncbi:TetR/AcrR family transcriptional regulator [Yinghuangia soli]|uniref:TetR/AcrR family transcriptional regulator n=1 Tax=Yinghuangia soli TaxID=2908204 RepID=A0AA41U569_9ACTN|nr:TetR/AcrR family transcriptional regulator [Yinghuangia soli]MCF2531587.1 TetR/AcrR family transcriptional regulator [Yinghuangia soli]